MEWDEEKAENIVKAHKSRFSLRLTLKIIRVLFILFVVYTLYMIIVSLSYNVSDIGKRTEFYQKLAIDWTYPEFTTEVGVSFEENITPLLTQEIDIPLIKQIGREDFVVSELHLRKPIFNTFTQVEVEKQYPYVTTNEHTYSFNLPYDPETNDKLSVNKNKDVWTSLENIHEGHVANIAFSFDNYYRPEEVMSLLSSYDLTVLWMPIYMGEGVEFDEGGWTGGSDTIALTQPWGLSGAREADKDYKSGSLLSLSEEWIKDSEEMMLYNMNMMLNEKKGLAETLLGTSYLNERYDYIKEHGFLAYGAIVTGPVKELIKLKELKEIHNVILGDMHYWNWDD